MIDASLKSRILDTTPGKYFYGRLVKKHTKYTLQIYESNTEEEFWCNRTLGEIHLFKAINRDWDYCLQETIASGEYTEAQFSIKKLSDDEFVIWVYDFENRILLEAQNELKKQQSLLEIFIDSIPDIIFYKDVNKTYITCNKALANLINKDKDYIIGKKDSEIDILVLQAHKCKEFDQKVIESKAGIAIEEKIFLPSGDARIMESLKVPFWSADNHLLGIIGICRDITEKRRAEEKIIHSEKRFKQVFDNISDAIMIIEEGKVIEVNDAYEQIYGESYKKLHEDIEMNYILDKVYKEDLAKIQPINYNEPFQAKGRILRGDGKEGWINMKYEAMPDGCWILVVTDITSQVQKERELENLRNEFFANLSHEFKTPVNLIHSALQLLRVNFKRMQLDEKDYSKCFDICNQNISRLLKLISNLIDSTKIDSGYFKYNPQNYNVVSVIEDTALSVLAYCEQNHIEMIFDTEMEEKILYFDLELMERIILNLLSNAIKYSKGTQLFVTVKQGEDNVLIIVEDNGVGIPKDYLDNIFEKFSQVNNRFTKVGEGSGLGLYLVKSFINMHNGEIFVQSELGKGTRFIISLPDIQGPDEPIYSSLYSKMEFVERTKFEFSDLI